MAETKKKYFHINTLEKGIKVLELLADEKALRGSQVAEALGFNRAGSHRFLSTLRELGYVEQDAQKRYKLTYKIFEIGMKMANRFNVLRVAFTSMQELAALYNETINLGSLDGTEIIHLDKIESSELLRIDPGIGTHAPAYCTGLGKAILAFLPDDELAFFMESVTFKSLTPNTITSRGKLEKELRNIRKTGVAVDNEELSKGLRCVAAPVFDSYDYPRYSISISGPTVRMSLNRIQKMKKDVLRVCETLSFKLGIR